ncbi:hypothetical protein J2Z21_009387 [Streptomyces griseochromogenes]|uniref:Uncharacterized protein n=1 Tax=Streptomyces griseochromogenes TaxID=68214 RepID=A0ABS4M9M3_9ACTN|nr:hypothetical protein [Streptomyces griseochromogenes]
MRISGIGQGYSSPHSLRCSTEWGVKVSASQVTSRGCPLVECAGCAKPSLDLALFKMPPRRLLCVE